MPSSYIPVDIGLPARYRGKFSDIRFGVWVGDSGAGVPLTDSSMDVSVRGWRGQKVIYTVNRVSEDEPFMEGDGHADSRVMVERKHPHFFGLLPVSDGIVREQGKLVRILGAYVGRTEEAERLERVLSAEEPGI